MNDINLYSNPKKALINAKKYLGEDTELYISNRKNMKYMILDDNNKFIHFGRIGYEDYTKHKYEKRRINYLKCATNINLYRSNRTPRETNDFSQFLFCITNAVKIKL